MGRVIFIALVVACTIGFVPRDSRAATAEVFPGTGTLQAAINAASEGTRLTLHPGAYIGAVVVTKRLTLECLHDTSNDGGCVIDAQCAAPIALDIAADKVQVKMSKKKILGAAGGPFVVTRGMTTGIRTTNQVGTKLFRVQVVPGYLSIPCGTEQVGIEVSGTSTGVKLDECYAPAAATAGIRISGVPLGSKIQLKRSDSTAGLNETALLIENSGGGATLGKGGITISDGHYAVAGSNGTAVRFVNSDGVRFKKSFMFVNPSPEVALTGIALDAGSDRNLFLSNTWTDPEADETAYSDAGTGNCGKGNNFAVPTCP